MSVGQERGMRYEVIRGLGAVRLVDITGNTEEMELTMLEAIGYSQEDAVRRRQEMADARKTEGGAR
jgi:hypothetical protein